MHWSKPWLSYAIAVGATLVAAVARYLIDYFVGPAPNFLLPFLLATILSAWHGGLRCGIFATALNVVVGICFLSGAPPSVQAELSGIVRFGIFAAMGVSISLLSEALHHYRRQAEAATLNAVQRQKELENEVLERRRLNATLEQRVDERTKALRESEERFRGAFDDAPIGMALVAPNTKWLWINRAFCDLVGYTEAELLGLDFQAITHPDDLSADLSFVQQMLDDTIKSYQMEKRYFHKEGKTIHVLLSVSLIRDRDGQPMNFVSHVQDITRRKEAEERIKASLQEKEVLLREIHHRVKNNLQIVSTLLDLQSGYTEDKQALEMFKESQARVRSMSLIHERLYRSHDLARVEFVHYVQQLADDLYHSYRLSSEEIVLEVDVDLPPLPIDVAIPCGLLINELMSNALKHAFNHANAGRIRIAFHRNGDNLNILKVADTGTGFPSNVDFRNATSFGLQLVNTLVEQLQGKLDLNSDRGTEFTVTFPNRRASTLEPK